MRKGGSATQKGLLLRPRRRQVVEATFLGRRKEQWGNGRCTEQTIKAVTAGLERNPVCSSDPEADFRAPRAFS